MATVREPQTTLSSTALRSILRHYDPRYLRFGARLIFLLETYEHDQTHALAARLSEFHAPSTPLLLPLLNTTLVLLHNSVVEGHVRLVRGSH